MLSLKDHPFTVETFFENSLVLTYAVPMAELEKFIPECLELDVFKDKWAFLAVALVKTKKLRPKGFPEFTGNDFILIGYRVFVTFTNSKGKKMRGLYILKSQTNKKKMEFWGNIFTHYNYTTTDIKFIQKDGMVSVTSENSGLDIAVRTGDDNIPLPPGSPFSTWVEARRYAGPLPFTFTYNYKTKEVLIIEGVRQNWTPKPVEVLKDEIGFIQDKKLQGVVLANAFMVENVPYHWKKGRKEVWNR
ncbi:MAG TPA: DUF2071 domain-containing protein [Ignavibacteria bacterium]|nr:DUF2071 domain-containing protein [Ignavibacteria bacterium]HMQ97385.1 DUF2071 domain-containing protein [Ignavibacteria bacterium]